MYLTLSLFGTPMGPSVKLDYDLNRKKVDVTLYRGMIGSLLYLTTSRLVTLSVCLCARYQANPKESHLSIVKRIMRYLIGISHIGLWNPKSNTCGLLSYLDVAFANSRTDRNSTIRGC